MAVPPPPHRWIVWYDDGSSFTDRDGEPHEAPRWGVMCIAAYSADHGRMIWHGTDYYVWDTEWISCDFVGLIDYLTRPGKEKTVLIGRHVSPRTFYAIYNAADSDPRLPPRSSRDALERAEPKP